MNFERLPVAGTHAAAVCRAAMQQPTAPSSSFSLGAGTDSSLRVLWKVIPLLGCGKKAVSSIV